MLPLTMQHKLPPQGLQLRPGLTLYGVGFLVLRLHLFQGKNWGLKERSEPVQRKEDCSLWRNRLGM
ncbi:hypothetical protein A2U01_0058565, partial [Trifolium medium]|nr:hypothetical protein [Trifolium medium]